MTVSKLWNYSLLGLIISATVYFALYSVINSPEMGGIFIALPVVGCMFVSSLTLLGSSTGILLTHRQNTKASIIKALILVFLLLLAIIVGLLRSA